VVKISETLVRMALVESSHRISKIGIRMVKWHSHIWGTLVSLGRIVVLLVIEICLLSHVLVQVVTLRVTKLWWVQIRLRISKRLRNL